MEDRKLHKEIPNAVSEGSTEKTLMYLVMMERTALAAMMDMDKRNRVTNILYEPSPIYKDDEHTLDWLYWN